MSRYDKSRGMNEATWRRIMQRQQTPRFLSQYQPAVLATKEEAPSISYAIQRWSNKNQRVIHCLSNQEAAFSEILEYHPNVVEYMEQHMLPNVPTPHPLTMHPLSGRRTLPRLEGILATGRSMGAQAFLPRFILDKKGNPFHGLWIGDFLVIVRDSDGIYAVNFSIKSCMDDFCFTPPQLHHTDGEKKRMIRAAMRHRIEEAMFAQAGIATRFIAVKETLSPCLIANLARMRRSAHEVNVRTPQLEQVVLDRFQKGIIKRSTPAEIFESLRNEYQYETYDMNVCFQYLMWTRQLRVDLEQPIANHRRLMPELHDPLIKWNPWFQRN